MKKIISAICCVCFLSYANAQDQNCDEAMVNAQGKWVMDANNIVYPEKTFPASQYSQLYTRLDKIAAMFKEAYPQPTGIQAKWYRSIRGPAMVKNGPVPYQFNSLYLGWYCNPNLHKLMVGSETGTWSFVYMNSFGWFMSDQNDKAGLSIDGAEAWLLPNKIGEWKGLPLYKPSGSGDKNKTVLITRDGQLPYKPASRLQFLQSLKAKIEADKKIQHEAGEKILVRSEAEEAAAKQKGLQDIEKTVGARYWEQRKAGYLKNYKTDEQRKQENIRLSDGFFDARLKPVNDELNNESSTELQRPAIVNNDYTSVFKGFTTDEMGGRMVVLINTAYFNMQLPKYMPQFIAVYWSWDKSSATMNFKNQFEVNFPIDKLKAMIDK